MPEPLITLQCDGSTLARDQQGPYTLGGASLYFDVPEPTLTVFLYEQGYTQMGRLRLDFTGTRDLQALVEALTLCLETLKERE